MLKNSLKKNREKYLNSLKNNRENNLKNNLNSLKNNRENNLKNNLNSLVSWEPNYHFKWNIKYINIYIYSPQSYKNNDIDSKLNILNRLSVQEKLNIYNPISKSNILNLEKINIYNNNNPLWLINNKNNSIKLRFINIKTAISNSRILLKILNKKKLGIMKYLEKLKSRPAASLKKELVLLNTKRTKKSKIMNIDNSKLELNELINKGWINDINEKLYKNWYDLINIKKINTIMTGIKLEIHGRLTKRKKASRTKKYIFLKGSINKNSNISLIDKSSIRMKVKNGSAGINIYISNKINIKN